MLSVSKHGVGFFNGLLTIWAGRRQADSVSLAQIFPGAGTHRFLRV
jgi:hypothetical protein